MMIQSQHYTTPLEQSSTPGVITSSSSFISVASSVQREQKRPLSGYNVFFILQRKRIIDGETDDHVATIAEVKEFIENQRIVRNLPQPKRMHRKTHGKIGFREMARLLAEKWKKLSPTEKQLYNDCADAEKHRCVKEKKERINNLNNNQCNVMNFTQTHSDYDNEQPVFILDDNSCCYRNGQYGIQSSVVTSVPHMVVQQTGGLQATEDQLECPPNDDEDSEDIVDDEDDYDLSDKINESRRVIQNYTRLIQYQKAKYLKQQQQMKMFILNQRKLKFMEMKMNQQRQQTQSLSSMMMYPPTSSDSWMESMNQQQKQQQIPMIYPTISNNNWTNTVPEMTPSNVMSSTNFSKQNVTTDDVANSINNSSWNLKTITNDDNDVDFNKDDDLVDNDNNDNDNYCINNVLDFADETFDGVNDYLTSNTFHNHFDADMNNDCNNNDDDNDLLLFEPITNYDLLDFQNENDFCM